MSDKLSSRQQKFVEFILAGMTGDDAAEAAGFSKGESAARTARRLLNDSKIIKAIEAEKGTAESGDDTLYDLKKAMREADLGYTEAVKAKSLPNILKSVELKSKLQGLLWERQRANGTRGDFILNLQCLDCATLNFIKQAAQKVGIDDPLEFFRMMAKEGLTNLDDRIPKLPQEGDL